jgi:hypothetical protein
MGEFLVTLVELAVGLLLGIGAACAFVLVVMAVVWGVIEPRRRAAVPAQRHPDDPRRT